VNAPTSNIHTTRFANHRDVFDDISSVIFRRNDTTITGPSSDIGTGVVLVLVAVVVVVVLDLLILLLDVRRLWIVGCVRQVGVDDVEQL
jgi:hypothetical protein